MKPLTTPSTRPPVSPWVVLGVASLAAFMVFLDAQVLFVAFDDIRSSFPSVSFTTMSWTLSAYTIALAAALVPSGRMADRFGRRRVFLVGLVAFTLASVLCAFAPTAGLLVVFRVVQALGAAALVPASLALVLSVFPTARVPVGGLLVLAAFVRRTLSAPHPALDLMIFARPSVRWANIATAAFTIGFTAMFFGLIQFMLVVWNYGVVRAGLAMVPGPVVVMVLAPVFGRVAARYGQRALLVPGGLVYAAGGALLLTRLGEDPAYASQVLPASLLAGLGVALVIPQLTSAAVQGLPPDEFAAGAAVNQAIRQLGATFGVALTVALLGTLTPTSTADDFLGVWGMLTVCGVLTSAAALPLPRRHRSAQPSPSPVTAGVRQ